MKFNNSKINTNVKNLKTHYSGVYRCFCLYVFSSGNGWKHF